MRKRYPFIFVQFILIFSMITGTLKAQLNYSTINYKSANQGMVTNKFNLKANYLNLRRQAGNSNVSFGAFGGFGFGSLRYFREADSLKADTDPEKYAGLLMEFPITTAGEHLYADAEIALSQFKSVIYNPHYVEPSSSGNSYSELTKEFSPTMLNIAVYLKYNITLRDFHPYAFVGINNNIILSGVNKTTEVIHWNDTSATVYRDAVDKPASYGMCVITGVGIEYKWFALEGRYQSGRSYSQYTDAVSVFRPALFALLRVKMFRKVR